MSTHAPPSPGPMARDDRGAPATTIRKTPAQLAFDQVLADPDLNASAKLVAGVVERGCKSDDNAVFFYGSRAVARLLGWDRRPDGDPVKDKGVARVNRAFADLAARGHGFRSYAGPFWRWFGSAGPALGLRPPRPRSRPRSYFVARWKRPDAPPEAWAIALPRAAPEEGAGAAFDAAGKRAGASRCSTPAPYINSAPARPPENSEFERGVRTEEHHVTALARGESKAPDVRPVPEAMPPPPPPSESEVADLLAQARSRVTLLRNLALWRLEDCGRLPAEWAGKVPARPTEPDPAKEVPPRHSPPAQLTPSEMLDKRLRVFAGRAPEADAVEDLAFDLAASLMDVENLETYWMAALAELASGDTDLDPFLHAMKRARAARPGEKGRAFGKTLKGYRGKGRNKRPPAGCVLATHRRAAQGTVSH